MTRLPQPGEDNGTWGDILNNFLDVAHNQDGTLKPSAVTNAGAVNSVNNNLPDADGNVSLTANDIGAVSTDQIGIANGVASLDNTGNVPASQLGNAPIPWTYARQFFSPPDLVVQGTWTVSATSLRPYAGDATNATVPAQNDGAAWMIDLVAGTWTMNLIYGIGATEAIITIDISFDGGSTWTAIGTVDTYASSGNFGTKAFTGITVAQSGHPLVRFRALSKNASSSGYQVLLNGQEWVRTA